MIKVILVPIDGTPRSEQVLDTAKIIAGRFNSHIKVVHVREQGAEPFLFSGVPEKMREQVAEMNAEMAGSLADEVRQQFEQFCQDNAIRITQKPSGAAEITASLHLLDGDARSMLVREARLVDVIAMARPYRHRIGGMGVGELHETVMVSSGRPVLIVPPDWEAHRARHAAVGWNDSLEASKALALTLPWLVQMKKVTVLVSKGSEQDGQDVVDYLQSHGCEADYHTLGKGRNVGKSILDSCAEIEADFLVIGGFSHTRARQRLFGGVTSYLLENTDVITVMAH